MTNRVPMILWTLTLIISLILSAPIKAQGTTTDAGWIYLLKNEETSAIDNFTRSVSAEPKDYRAWLGLSFAHGLRLNDDASWDAFYQALEVHPNSHPLVYASMITRRFSSQTASPKSSLESVLSNIISKPDELGILKAMAYAHLAGIEERRGNVQKSKALYSNIGAVETWRMIGPFHNVSGAGYDKVFPPEFIDDTTGVYEGLSGVQVRWHTPQVFRNDGWVDYARYFPTISAVFYSTTYAWSDESRRVQFRIGTSGAYKAFLNDSLISSTSDEHNNDLDTYNSEVTLQKGWNRILIKCSSSELNRCNFLFRITDAKGEPLTDLKYSSNPQEYSRSDPESMEIPNPFITYLRNMVREHPTQLENSWLLAEALLRNDEATLAERVLRKALKQAPDCIVTLNLAAEAHNRGSKRDELQSTTERMSVLRPDLPTSLSYAFQKAMDADRIDDAESIVDVMKNAMPGSTDYYDAALTITEKRDRVQQFAELVDEAIKKHPYSLNYATMGAILALRGKGSRAEAIQHIERVLMLNYTEQALLILANLQREAGKIDEWERTFDKLFALSPAAPGYYSIMSDVWSQRNEYEKALASVNKGIAIAPSVSSQWYKVGVLQRSLHRMDESRKAFEMAIQVDPSNFDAREALRDVTKTRSPFSYMGNPNIDSLVANAPTASDYPEAKAVYLLDDTRRVVYSGSNCEIAYEMLIRILTPAGIDRYKEMSLPGAGGAGFTVDKAVVRKPNGKEIPADRSGGQVVFKGLEPGDFIYVKTKSRESFYGEMAKHFQDDKLFNAFVPVLSCTYSLLTPTDTPFSWSMSNSGVQPVTSKTDAGDLWVWSATNLPAIEYEEGMPSTDNIGVVLQITSIKSWGDLVSWYSDIANTKSKPSIEVTDVMEELFPSGQVFSDDEVVEGVYKYITEQIRYSNVSFRQSGIVPQKARDVLATRIGDCKDVATLCIAMLAERKIPAYHVLVNTYSSPLQRNILPSIPFDHDIVLVDFPDRPLFLDLTATDVPIGSLPYADINALALIIKPGWIRTLRIPKNLFTPRNVNVNTVIDIQPNLEAKISQTVTCNGSLTQWYRSSWKEKSIEDIKKSMLEELSEQVANVTLDSFQLDDLHNLSPTFTYTSFYSVPDYLHESGELLILDIPWFNKNLPDPALAYESRTYPYEYKTYTDTIIETVTVAIPEGYEILGGSQQYNATTDNFVYNNQSTTNKSSLIVNRMSSWKQEFVMPENYSYFKSEYNKVVRADRQSIVFVPKGTVIKFPAKHAGKSSSKQK